MNNRQEKFDHNHKIFNNKQELLFKKTINDLQENNMYNNNYILLNKSNNIKVLSQQNDSIINIMFENKNENDNYGIRFDINYPKYLSTGVDQEYLNYFLNVESFIDEQVFLISFDGKYNNEDDKKVYNDGIILFDNGFSDKNIIEITLKKYYVKYVLKTKLNLIKWNFTALKGACDISIKNLDIRLENPKFSFNKKILSLGPRKSIKWDYIQIPRVAFTYWSGKMSYLHYLSLKSFKYLNPDWKIILYQPKFPYNGENTWTTLEHSTKYTGKDYSQQALKLDINIITVDLSEIGFRNDVPEVFKSNYVTYYILVNDGGVYFDMDVLFIKPMNELDLKNKIICGNTSDLSTVICYYDPKEKNHGKYFSVGLLLGTPKSKFYKLLFDELLINFDPTSYMSATNHLYPKVYEDLDGIQRKLPDLKFANMEMDVVYPYNCNEMDILFKKNDLTKIKDTTIGIHWYNGHPVTKIFLNEADYDKKVTINQIIKKYLSNINNENHYVKIN